MRTFLYSIALAMLPLLSVAQDRTPSHCIALADAAPGLKYLHKASFGDPLPAERVRINYIDHSTFLIETAGGKNMATDYTGFLGITDVIPDVVTMNHAHTSHWTSNPDPRIPNILRGWGDDTGPADHHVDLGEVLVRNVPTDIRSRFGDGVEIDGNSIFIFELAGLCIGHLGHLHHEPTPEDYAAIGRLDVVMAAVDGGLTVPTETMVRIIKRLRSSIVLPMHWFSSFSLESFLEGVSEDFDIVRVGDTFLEVSLDTLPSRPQIMVLQPRFIQDFDPDN